MSLTLKQEKFVEELIAGKSQREAYKSAYNTERMKDSSIDTLASRLFSKVEIRSRYEELKSLTEQKTGDDAASIRAMIIDNDRTIAKSCVMDFYEMAEDKHGRPIVQIKDLSKIDTRAIQEIGFDQYGRVKIKLYDRYKAEENLAKLFGLDKDAVDNKITVTIRSDLENYAD